MFWVTKFAKLGGSLKGAIKEFTRMNGRMPSSAELNKMETIIKDAKSNVIQFPSKRITASKTTPKDPIDQRWIDQQAWAAKKAAENKQGAYNFALKRAMEIDKKPLELPEVLKRYETLSKYPDGRSYLIDEVHDIEKGWTLPNIGQRTRQDVVTKIKGFLEKKAEGGIAGQLHLNQGGRARFENGLKVTDDDFYLGDPGFLRELPDPYKDLPEEEREMRKAMDEIMRRRFYKELSSEDLEKLKIQRQIREKQRKDMGLPEGIELLNQGGRVAFSDGMNLQEQIKKLLQKGLGTIAVSKQLGVNIEEVEHIARFMKYGGARVPIDQVLERRAKGGRVGFDKGSPPTFAEGVKQMYVSDEAGALPKKMKDGEGGVLPEDMGKLKRKDFDSEADYKRYLRRLNKKAKGGRINFDNGGVSSIFGNPDRSEYEEFMKKRNKNIIVFENNLAKRLMNEHDLDRNTARRYAGTINFYVNSNPRMLSGKEKILEKGYLGDNEIISKEIENTDNINSFAFAKGGRIKYALGTDEDNGLMALKTRINSAGVKELDLRDDGGFIPPIGVKEKADDIPAMVSNNEFVMTADAVKGLGNGNVEKGAQKMYDLMKSLESRIA